MNTNNSIFTLAHTVILAASVEVSETITTLLKMEAKTSRVTLIHLEQTTITNSIKQSLSTTSICMEMTKFMDVPAL